MFRPPTSGKSTTTTAAATATATNKQQQGNNGGNNNNNNNNTEQHATTIREIRSRTIGSNSSSSCNTASSRTLLTNRRQAMSMEKLNGGNQSNSSQQDKDKNSPSSSGSSNSINSSPSRGTGAGGGLNRTASRVSRFRSAKAVFERLSNGNNATINKTTDSKPPEKPRGTVASRYAAAAAARATSHANNNNHSSPRSRLPSGALARSHESGKSTSNIEINKSSTQQSPNKSDSLHPRPQPRVITSRSVSNHVIDSSIRRSSATVTQQSKQTAAQAKPPPKDLIDKIVLEIALDAKQEIDPNCTIQDLSNCDVSGIPETLDFDRCFQDVELMTEEEARKLLSRKHESSLSVEASSSSCSIDDPSTVSDDTSRLANEKVFSGSKDGSVPKDTEPAAHRATVTNTNLSNQQDSFSDNVDSSTSSTSNKSKVRFSDEPVKVFNTHAVEDYDRRNDDIDPVAASAEYEIEKSKSREGLMDSEDEEDGIEAVNMRPTRGNFNQADDQNSETRISGILGNSQAAAAAPLHNEQYHDSSEGKQNMSSADDNEEQGDTKEYIESLKREIGLKRILEQNLRDLQSQYYEAVKELDDYKSNNESKLTDLTNQYKELNCKFDSSQTELSDALEQSATLEKQLTEIKDSSQILEKKYHRAKRIIKDMQSREQSFTRREQLYQQKLDEIEFELGVLIESIDRTVYEEGARFCSIADGTGMMRQQQIKVDAFGLIKQMLNNFNANQSTQNPQIKQRVISILEQQLANLMVSTGASAAPTLPILPPALNNSIGVDKMSQLVDNNGNGSRHSQTTYQFASHRLSQPNLPHPVGVGGQPTKMFHTLNSMNNPNESSPPQSVNSYPSTNSLNSLNNNNSNVTNNNNNNVIIPAKLREQPSISDLQLNMPSIIPSVTGIDEKCISADTTQAPFQTDEWSKPVSEWTTTQVSTWLLALGLDQYISKFEDRNVNGQSLINLDSTVLKGLGVLNSNDRNLLKKKIRELRLDMEKERKSIEKKMKENLKDKSKTNAANKSDSSQQTKPSWKLGLLS